MPTKAVISILPSAHGLLTGKIIRKFTAFFHNILTSPPLFINHHLCAVPTSTHCARSLAIFLEYVAHATYLQ